MEPITLSLLPIIADKRSFITGDYWTSNDSTATTAYYITTTFAPERSGDKTRYLKYYAVRVFNY
jgi:hypothetical protein